MATKDITLLLAPTVLLADLLLLLGGEVVLDVEEAQELLTEYHEPIKTEPHDDTQYL